MSVVTELEDSRLVYERDPQAIYRQSFSIVQAETDFDRFPQDFKPLVTRLIHACGMPEIAPKLAFSPDAVAAGQAALANGAPILCDCEMVRSGIIQRNLSAKNDVMCTLNDDSTRPAAASLQTTRSAAAVEAWLPHIDGAVVVVGNAPTTLFHLLERLDDGWPKPAAILGFPVGFVGAAESKDALAADPRGVPFITLRGRQGGSAMASAALNALAAGLGTGS